jgi:hypothetical protein
MESGGTRSLLPQPIWRPGGLDTIPWRGGCPRTWSSVTHAMAPCGTSRRGPVHTRECCCMGMYGLTAISPQSFRRHAIRPSPCAPQCAKKSIRLASGQAATTAVLSTTPALRDRPGGVRGAREFHHALASPLFPAANRSSGHLMSLRLSLGRLYVLCTCQASVYQVDFFISQVFTGTFSTQ